LLELDFVDHVQNQIIGRKFWALLEMLLQGTLSTMSTHAQFAG